jgi:hypothetical protein
VSNETSAIPQCSTSASEYRPVRPRDFPCSSEANGGQQNSPQTIGFKALHSCHCRSCRHEACRLSCDSKGPIGLCCDSDVHHIQPQASSMLLRADGNTTKYSRQTQYCAHEICLDLFCSVAPMNPKIKRLEAIQSHSDAHVLSIYGRISVLEGKREAWARSVQKGE